MPRNTPEEALRGFYEAMFRDLDFERACRFAAPGFHLRGWLSGELIQGPCSALAARVQASRGDLYPWSAWRIESVEIAGDGTAAAVTDDGSAGLRVVDGEWRLAWLIDVA